ncbi:hypothetical protein B0O80DRAFT_475682 [Mortierella sp. GBAus27b]|nr:hypothetical protein B0O80DRAFT_475682 [Mortierella sp. GBAus27b]
MEVDALRLVDLERRRPIPDMLPIRGSRMWIWRALVRDIRPLYLNRRNLATPSSLSQFNPF